MTFFSLILIGAGIIVLLALLLSHFHFLVTLLWIVLNSTLLLSINAEHLALIYLVLSFGTLLLSLFQRPLQSVQESVSHRKKNIYLGLPLFLLILGGNLVLMLKTSPPFPSPPAVWSQLQAAPFFLFSAGVLLTFIVGVTYLRPGD